MVMVSTKREGEGSMIYEHLKVSAFNGVAKMLDY